MTDHEILERMLEIQRQIIQLKSESDDAVAIHDFSLQVSCRMFEALFPDGPDEIREAENFYHKSHLYGGTSVAAIYPKEPIYE